MILSTSTLYTYFNLFGSPLDQVMYGFLYSTTIWQTFDPKLKTLTPSRPPEAME
jgi:hypothetical protein